MDVENNSIVIPEANVYVAEYPSAIHVRKFKPKINIDIEEPVLIVRIILGMYSIQCPINHVNALIAMIVIAVLIFVCIFMSR